MIPEAFVSLRKCRPLVELGIWTYSIDRLTVDHVDHLLFEHKLSRRNPTVWTNSTAHIISGIQAAWRVTRVTPMLADSRDRSNVTAGSEFF